MSVINYLDFRLGSRFGAGNIDGFNMMSLMLPGVAVTYNGEEIGMTNTAVSWEDTVDPAGLNCGEEHFMVTATLTMNMRVTIMLISRTWAAPEIPRGLPCSGTPLTMRASPMLRSPGYQSMITTRLASMWLTNLRYE